MCLGIIIIYSKFNFKPIKTIAMENTQEVIIRLTLTKFGLVSKRSRTGIR